MPQTVLADIGSVWSTSNHTYADPGSGGTVQQNNVAYGVLKVASGTRVLPDNGLPMYVQSTSGAITVNSVAGTTIATVAAGKCSFFVPLTSTTWGVQSTNAADVSLLDSAGYTSAANVETALAHVMRDSQLIWVPMFSFTDADGDPLAKFADNASPNPGFTLANSKAAGIRWNNNATQNQPVLTTVFMPAGATGVLTMNVYASKVGATVGDATTFTVAAYAQCVDSLHDAGSDLGGATSAMTGNAATKTVQRVTLTMTAAEGATSTGYPMTFTITPTSGTLGTDDVIIHGIAFRWTA